MIRHLWFIPVGILFWPALVLGQSEAHSSWTKSEEIWTHSSDSAAWSVRGEWVEGTSWKSADLVGEDRWVRARTLQCDAQVCTATGVTVYWAGSAMRSRSARIVLETKTITMEGILGFKDKET